MDHHLSLAVVLTGRVSANRMIVRYPNKVLNTPAFKIEAFDDEGLSSLGFELASVLKGSHDGIGLAAPQIGNLRRMIALKEGDQIIHMVNPDLVFESPEKLIGPEGCLSLPGIAVNVPRAKFVIVEYRDLSGHEHSRNCVGLFARVIQHEIDHLNGVMMIDRITSKQKKIAMKGYK